MKLATLGPAGSNHDFVARRYLDAVRVDAEVRLDADFPAAFAALAAGEVDAVLQVAVHPTAPQAIGGVFGDAHLIDCFLSPSQAMAVLTRADVATPRTIGLVPPTRHYVDTARWAEVVEAPSTVDVWRGLQARRFDSGLTLRRFADAAPGAFRVEQEIPPVTDAWLVYGRKALSATAIRSDGPGADALRRLGGGDPRLLP